MWNELNYLNEVSLLALDEIENKTEYAPFSKMITTFTSLGDSASEDSMLGDSIC